MIRSELVELWKSRVRYLRQYYCFHGHRPKQRGFPTLSRHVWFIPFILTLWWLVIAIIFLYTLKLEHLLNTGDIIRYLLGLYFLLALLLWKLAITESEGTLKPHLCKGPPCLCPLCANHEFRYGCTIRHGDMTVVILPLKRNWKCYQRRKVLLTVQYSDNQVATYLLLLLAGDVETNPGPDHLTIKDHFKVTEYLRYLSQEDQIRLGGALGLHYTNLKEMTSLCGDMVLAWLKQQDNVTQKSGKPTWESLFSALKLIGHEGLAKTITKELKLEMFYMELVNVSDKWFRIGRQLGINIGELNAFKSEYREDKNALLKKCLDVWLETTSDCTWEALISALEDSTVDEPKLTERLRRKHTRHSTQKGDSRSSPKNQHSKSAGFATSAKPAQVKDGKWPTGATSVVHWKKPRIWPPLRENYHLYLAVMRDRTRKMKSKYTTLFLDFRTSFLERDLEDHFQDLYSVTSDYCFDEAAMEEIIEKRDVKGLLMQVFYHQSFMNFELLVDVIIERVGSDEDKKNAREYLNSFKEYLKLRVFDRAPDFSPDLDTHCTVIFVVDWNQPEYKISEVCDFKIFIGEILNIDPARMLVFRAEKGSLVVHLQIAWKDLQRLETMPLFPRKLRTIKDKGVQSYKFENREVVMLKHWKVLTDVTLEPPEDSSPVKESPAHKKQSNIVLAKHQGKECMALVYPAQFTDESKVDTGYIKYLELLIRNHREVPSIEGLYYPLVEGEEPKKYPAVIIEKLEPLKEVVSYYRESEVNQLSLLTSISSCLSRFENLNQKLKVVKEHIFIKKKDAELEAKLIPVYGHSFIGEQSSPTSETLSYDDLLWMKEMILSLFSHDNVAPSPDDVQLPSNHLLKNIFKQKWLSKGSQFRPASYSVLTDELRHVLETEKTWIGLVNISDIDLVEDEIQIHVTLIGHTGVGKTSLRKHLKDEPIDKHETPTIVMQSEFLYQEAAVAESAFKPLLHLPSDCQNKVSITMWDAGGKPIFQDLLPCFARLKCMYGICFRLYDLKNLDDKPASSPFSHRDILYRNLSFVQAFSSGVGKKTENLPPQVKSRDSQNVPTAAVVVGTFNDQAIIHEGDLYQDRKDALNESIGRFARKYKSDFSIYTAKEQDEPYIHEVDNTGALMKLDIKIDPGIKSLRNTISSYAKDLRSEIPRSWQAFKLALQRLCYTEYVNIGIIPLDEAISIGKSVCHVDEPRAALVYFHELGVFMWHHLSERRIMRNFVVIDPKTLFQALGTLLNYDSSSLTPEWSMLTKKGIVPMSLYRYLLDKKPNKFDDDWVIEFLEEHHLAVKVDFPGEEICYFIPSVLPVRKEYGKALKQLNGEDRSPMYIVPETDYIPTAMFTRLLTALAGVTCGNTRWSIPLDNDKQFTASRNQFEFRINDSVRVILSEFPHYIRVDCVPYDNANLSKDIHYHVLSTLNVQLQRIVPRWLEKKEFDLTFVCTNETCSSTAEHFYSIKKLTLESDVCECTYGQENKLKDSELIWFGSETVSKIALANLGTNTSCIV